MVLINYNFQNIKVRHMENQIHTPNLREGEKRALLLAKRSHHILVLQQCQNFYKHETIISFFLFVYVL